jgi:hypothetical protein
MGHCTALHLITDTLVKIRISFYVQVIYQGNCKSGREAAAAHTYECTRVDLCNLLASIQYFCVASVSNLVIGAMA